MKGRIKTFLSADNPANYTRKDLNAGDVVYSASDPYGCVDRTVGQAIKLSDDSPYPYFEVPIGAVDWDGNE